MVCRVASRCLISAGLWHRAVQPLSMAGGNSRDVKAMTNATSVKGKQKRRKARESGSIQLSADSPKAMVHLNRLTASRVGNVFVDIFGKRYYRYATRSEIPW